MNMASSVVPDRGSYFGRPDYHYEDTFLGPTGLWDIDVAHIIMDSYNFLPR